MSWLFSQALVAEYSQATCWAGAPCAQLSVMPTQHKFWHNGKTMEASSLSRFGLTCAALTEDRGADLLTWFREASRARTSALPARAPALTVSAADCGTTWRGSLARFDPASATWKTAQPSLLGDSDECSVTWPRSGMTAGGLCWELPTLAPPHQRDRLWLVAADADRARQLQPEGRQPDERRRTGDSHSQDADTLRPRLPAPWPESLGAYRRLTGRSAPAGSWWPAEPDLVRVVHGLPARMERIACLGNAQVPVCAATAWRMLTGGVRNTHNARLSRQGGADDA